MAAQQAVEAWRRWRDTARRPEAVYRDVFVEMPVAMVLLDAQMRIVEINDHLAGMVADAATLRHQSVTALAGPPSAARLGLMTRKALETGETVIVEHRYVTVDGFEGWARTSVRRVETADREVSLVCVLEDITSDQRALEEHRRAAEVDPLTGLLNRRGWDRRLRSALARMAQAGPIAVIIGDADRFKDINDRYGHAAGDQILTGMAGRLRSAIRYGDDVARLGGDEFMIVARVSNARDAAAIAERCVRTVGAPFRFDVGDTHLAETVTISVGVAVAYPEGTADPSSLLAAADRALYQAKAAGGNGWRPAESPL